MKKRFRDEFVGAQLGDMRRADRLAELGIALAAFPAASFPQVLGDGGDLEAAYRFLSNPDIEADAVLGPHLRETVIRCGERSNVVVAHDTTDFVFPGEKRSGLGRMRGTKERGFFAHLSLAVSSDPWREPLGVAHLETWTREAKKRHSAKKSPRERQRDPERESLRWLRGVEAVEQAMPGQRPIHVMDREADAYDIFAALVEKGRRFVVRSKSDRRVADGGTLSDHLEGERVAMTREVTLSARKTPSFPAQRKIHPPRCARTALLGVKAAAVTLLRPRDLPSSLPPSLTVNVVVVEEIDPPPGEPSVSWRLYTTESIATRGAIEKIVDAYRCRWRIEEFFKALKSGCAIEKRQLESAHALINALAIYVPIAWRVLRHRTLAHHEGAGRATAVLTPQQIWILRRVTRIKLSRHPTLSEALAAIAQLGGHLKRNGSPGWMTLARGYERLLTMEEGYALADAA